MNIKLLKSAAAIVLSTNLVCTAHSHINYTGRDFGIFTLDSERSFSISNQTVTSNFGWADGTDSDFGDSHRVRPFRFTLEDPMLITISIQGGGGLLPGFSIYSGLAHLAPSQPDHDLAPVTLSYLQFLGGGKEGAFIATGNWRMGNDDGASFSDLSTFMFEGYGVDGTSANFGPAPGVVGDGFADGVVTKTFPLLPGDYTLFVGGANYSGTTTTSFPVAISVNNTASVPEAGAAISLIGGLATLCGLRRRRP
jgi:hypothetical protein